jgi:hypothetical protein
MSLEAATWVIAAATVILAVFAVVTARYARSAYVTQSAQLDDQCKELQQAAAGRKRDPAERHRAQALQVYLRREYVSPMYDLDPRRSPPACTTQASSRSTTCDSSGTSPTSPASCTTSASFR